MTLEPVIGCTPDAIAAAFPCVKCLQGEKERWMAIVYITWRLVNGPSATFNVDTLAADAACFNCISDDELLDYAVNLLAKLAIQQQVVPENPAVTDAACLECEDELTLKRQALYLFCQYINGQVLIL